MSLPAQVSVAELASAIADGAYVVDVREPDEYAAAHVPGAVPMPMGSVPQRYDELPRDRTVYLVCAVGARSMQVARYLDQMGFDVRNVDGGTGDWIGAGYPVKTGPEAG
ncbi:MAG: rhodanese-like domain-containing protein [Jiangellaceae bacterium]